VHDSIGCACHLTPAMRFVAYLMTTDWRRYDRYGAQTVSITSQPGTMSRGDPRSVVAEVRRRYFFRHFYRQYWLCSRATMRVIPDTQMVHNIALDIACEFLVSEYRVRNDQAILDIEDIRRNFVRVLSIGKRWDDLINIAHSDAVLLFFNADLDGSRGREMIDRSDEDDFFNSVERFFHFHQDMVCDLCGRLSGLVQMMLDLEQNSDSVRDCLFGEIEARAGSVFTCVHPECRIDSPSEAATMIQETSGMSPEHSAATWAPFDPDLV